MAWCRWLGFLGPTPNAGQNRAGRQVCPCTICVLTTDKLGAGSAPRPFLRWGMELSRRKIFGVAAGAAIAGPKIARDIGGEMAAQGATPAVYGFADKCAGEGPSRDFSYFHREVARYRAKLTGALDDSDCEPPSSFSDDPARTNIEALRSVSAAGKARLHSDLSETRAKANRISYAQRQLRRLYEEWGLSIPDDLLGG